jgi:hypothetical protein
LIGALGGSSETAVKALGLLKAGNGNPQQQVSGFQQYTGEPVKPLAVPNTYEQPVAPPGGSAYGPPQQSPEGVAQVGAQNAIASLNTHKDTNPSDFRAAAFGATSPEGQAALTQAVSEGRLDPMRINSRTAPILSQMELASPGTTNFNRLHADATLQANTTFQQRAMSVDMLPGLLQNVTSLGKKLNGGTGYNDLKSVGVMQQWLNGQTNDPDYTEYMAARNDAMLRLASVMRGVGMSDQAHTAEVEAGAPTLAPAALDAWLKGQMSVVNPLLQRQNRITHLGETGQGTGALNAPPAAPAGAPIGTYPDEASALAAGHRSGDRVVIGGVSGTLQ